MSVAIYNPEIIVDEVFALYARENEDYTGESASQLEHMSQAAALAEEEGFEDEVVLAAFFHDIGHLYASSTRAINAGGFDNTDHEKLGADYLRDKGFSERIASLVQSHVVAKRYLCYKYPEYYSQLSDAGKAALELQGGRMTEKEAKDFESNPDAELFIRLRYWDDKAKETNIPVHDMSHLKLLAISHLYKNN